MKLPGTDIVINKTKDKLRLQWCAQLMTANEPWISLGRDYDHSIKLLNDPLAELYFLSKNDTPVGFVMIKLKGSFIGYIQIIAIDAPFRNQGIGEAAIKFVESEIFKISPNVFICVSSFNHRARNLYEKMGYEMVGILKDYIVRGYDEILLRKTLGPLNTFSPAPELP